MDKLLELLLEINKEPNKINNVRHEALTELDRLYKNGIIQRANELLKIDSIGGGNN